LVDSDLTPRAVNGMPLSILWERILMSHFTHISIMEVEDVQAYDSIKGALISLAIAKILSIL